MILIPHIMPTYHDYHPFVAFTQLVHLPCWSCCLHFSVAFTLLILLSSFLGHTFPAVFCITCYIFLPRPLSLPTSVLFAQIEPLGRKSVPARDIKLPYQMVKTGLWDGSQSLRRFKNFRPKCRIHTSGTEVGALFRERGSTYYCHSSTSCSLYPPLAIQSNAKTELKRLHCEIGNTKYCHKYD